MRRQAIALFAGVGLLMHTACKHAEKPSVAPLFTKEGKGVAVGEGSPLRQKLQVGEVHQQNLSTALSAPAMVEVDPADLVKVVPPMAGRIVKLHVRLGDWVKKGQALVTLDAPDVAQAIADCQKAGAQHRLNQKAVERAREMARHDVISKKELEQAETDYEGAHSEWCRAKARMSQLGLASPTGGGQLVLRSPINGRVSDFSASCGGYWNDTNAPLMVIADLKRVWFVAQVQEKDIPKVSVGQKVRTCLASFPGVCFSGRVDCVGDLLDATTRTVKVRVATDNAAGKLLPAMFANMTFLTAPREGVVVPMTAVIHYPGGARVFVETSPWRFEVREVKEGAHLDDGQVEVIEGLKAGERVALKEGVLLND